MIIHKGQFGQLYEGIKSDFPSSEDKKLIVFVSAADCDSVCALRILSVRNLVSSWDFHFIYSNVYQSDRKCLIMQIFLKADNVYFSVFPVTTYTEIQTICETQLASNEVRTLFWASSSAFTFLLQGKYGKLCA
jgi:hypothetical protein